MQHRWLCYYTKSDQYECEFLETQRQFAAHGITIEGRVLEGHSGGANNQPAWMRLCLQRSIELAKEAEKDKTSVLGLIDTDLIVWRPPVEMHIGLDHYMDVSTEQRSRPDMMIPDLGGDMPRGKRYSAGLLAFGPSPKGRETLRFWANECQQDTQPHKGLREQWYLYRAIEQCRPLIHRLDPRVYNWAPANENEDPKACVVMHTRSGRWRDRWKEWQAQRKGTVP